MKNKIDFWFNDTYCMFNVITNNNLPRLSIGIYNKIAKIRKKPIKMKTYNI